MNPWKRQARKAMPLRQPTGRGWIRARDVARQLGLSVDRARLVARRMAANGLVEIYNGTSHDASGGVSRCTFYRLKKA